MIKQIITHKFENIVEITGLPELLLGCELTPTLTDI